jgi:2-hydroxychromene-2-carboxylate isomerase
MHRCMVCSNVSAAPLPTLGFVHGPTLLDFWLDFASTYFYPAATCIRAPANEIGVNVRFRPFLLGPIFKAQGWDTLPFNI